MRSSASFLSYSLISSCSTSGSPERSNPPDYNKSVIDAINEKFDIDGIGLSEIIGAETQEAGSFVNIPAIVHDIKSEADNGYLKYRKNQLPEYLKKYISDNKDEILKTINNPFEGKRNKLTPNQIRKRRRMMKFVKNG